MADRTGTLWGIILHSSARRRFESTAGRDAAQVCGGILRLEKQAAGRKQLKPGQWPATVGMANTG
jgi:hypothetical protein